MGWDFRDLHGIDTEIIDVIEIPRMPRCYRDPQDAKML
jgi:hypothetical protein